MCNCLTIAFGSLFFLIVVKYTILKLILSIILECIIQCHAVHSQSYATVIMLPEHFHHLQRKPHAH